MIRFLRTLKQDVGGHSAVEFALTAPVLIAVVVAGYAGWAAAGRHQNLHAALDVAADYYMAGGTDDKVAEALVTAGWDKPPANAEVVITRTCACGSTVRLCTETCNSDPPAVYVRIQGRANDPNAQVTKVLSGSRTIRVR